MKVSRSALLAYSAQQIYDIVADIEHYPDFLEGCVGTEILSKSGQQITAKVNIQYHQLKQEFVTCNTNETAQSISMRLVEGAFSKLNGQWKFKALSENACKVSLDMEFEFNNAMLSRIISPLFNQLVNRQFEAFVARAKQLYA